VSKLVRFCCWRDICFLFDLCARY